MEREHVSGLVGPVGMSKLTWLLWNYVPLMCGSNFVKVPGKPLTRDAWLVHWRKGCVSHAAEDPEVAWGKLGLEAASSLAGRLIREPCCLPAACWWQATEG